MDGASSVLRRGLRLADLAALAKALQIAERPGDIYQAVEQLCGEVIGHRLFTIMRVVDGSDVERVHTSMPAIYSVGGRKRKAQTQWADHVLREMKPFRASCPEEIRATFDDHQTILDLGIGSILNIPIVFQRRCVGTMNLCHNAGWYRQEDESAGVLLAVFLVPALLDSEHDAR